MSARSHKGLFALLLGVSLPVPVIAGGGGAAPALKFNVAANSGLLVLLLEDF